ncbi:hypothetical protein AMP9_3807 [plant metagenome]|uniref:Uncharacterized protein n=1 Tax=plant metagenome TaxID=1297885 RepID=A0A484P4E9_9ZZZZ
MRKTPRDRSAGIVGREPLTRVKTAPPSGRNRRGGNAYIQL